MLITTEQAKAHLKINATLSENSFSPFIPDAEEKYIKPFLGTELFDLLQEYSKDMPSDDTELAALYEKVVPALSRFTLLIAAPHLDLNIGDSGFSVTSTNNLAPASRERVKAFMDSTEKLAWDNIETLLRFLEENASDYQEWVDSEAYTMQKRNLINSAIEFDNYVDIDKSRLTFHKLRKHIDNVEEIEVKKLISTELFNTLLEKIRALQPLEEEQEEGEEEEEEEIDEDLILSDAESILLHHLKAFIANRVASKYLSFNTDSVATFHYNEARAYLNNYPDSFPDYVASEMNDGEIPPFYDFNNDEESSIFLA